MECRSLFNLLSVGIKAGCSDENLERLMKESRSVAHLTRTRCGTLSRNSISVCYVARHGQEVDSLFLRVPIQRNTQEENKTIKNDEALEI